MEPTKDMEDNEDEAKMNKNIELSKQDFKKWVGVQKGTCRRVPPIFGL